MRTLSTVDNIDMNSIYELIEEIGELKTQMMKQETALHQGGKILTDDQRVFFDVCPQHPDVHPKNRK